MAELQAVIGRRGKFAGPPAERVRLEYQHQAAPLGQFQTLLGQQNQWPQRLNPFCPLRRVG